MQQHREALQRLKRDTAYLQQHREKLLELYPEQWVAIFDEQVVGVAPEFDHLLDSLQARGVPVGQVLIEHLTRKEGLLILLE